MTGVDVADRLRDAGAELTVTERRIADVILRTPHTIGFGTVAQVAAAADAGAASVVRLATKLGYDGYVELQRAVQAELTGHLGPAATRIRSLGDDDDVLVRQAEAEHRNVDRTFGDLEAASVGAVVAGLADPERQVLVLSGAASRGVATQFVHDLCHLRPAVRLLDGNHVEVLEVIALAPESTLVVAIDLRRYDRWLVDTLDVVAERGFVVISISDSVLSPLAAAATHSFVVTADSVGPFDSHVGTLALLNLLVAEVAHTRRDAATDRLDRLEDTWSAADALHD